MDATPFWEVFLDTGAPEMFLLYQKLKKMEETDVLDDQRSGAASLSI